MAFQPTRPLRGATDIFGKVRANLLISTHAPLAGRDDRGIAFFDVNIDFNPRAPCGARPSVRVFNALRLDFNPRAPCGARRAGAASPYHVHVISTHAPLAGRDIIDRLFADLRFISTHAPLAGRDSVLSVKPPHELLFQPTRPLRGATEINDRQTFGHWISTHAPLAGRDINKMIRRFLPKDFNPRAPCGARRLRRADRALRRYFNPRAPCGARRRSGGLPRSVFYFNPRAPCGARLVVIQQCFHCLEDFNPRAPCGARPFPTCDA